MHRGKYDNPVHPIPTRHPRTPNGYRDGCRIHEAAILCYRHEKAPPKRGFVFVARRNPLRVLVLDLPHVVGVRATDLSELVGQFVIFEAFE